MLLFRLSTVALLIVLVVIVGGRGTPLLRVGNGGSVRSAREPVAGHDPLTLERGSDGRRSVASAGGRHN
jgi:hypothetical protein